MAYDQLNNQETLGTIRGKINANFARVFSEKAETTSVLTKTNTLPYTPTQPTHPATKGYADSISTSWKSIYDPTNVAGDAFERANHTGTLAPSVIVQTVDDTFVSAAERVSWTAKEDAIGVKGTAFNKNFGTTGTTVAVGNHGHTKTEVGLGNVDNTSDVNKAVSTPQQAALDLKRDLDNNIFTGDITADNITKQAYNAGTGVLSGGTISLNVGDNTKIDITEGRALIADFTNIDDPRVKEITWAAQTVSPGLSPSRGQWVAVKESSTPGIGEFVFDPEFSQAEKRLYAIVGRVWGSGLDQVITGFGQYTTPGFGQAKTAEDLVFIFGSINKTGNVYTPNGINLLLNKSSGTSFRFSAGWATNPTAPNVHNDASQDAIAGYDYFFQGSNIADTQGNIDPDYYDLNGVKTAVPANKYTLQRLYYYPVSQVIAITYGQELFNTMTSAILKAGEDEITISEGLIAGGILRGWMALKQGATDLSDTSQALFRIAQSIPEPKALGKTGTSFVNRSYAISDSGSSNIFYAGGFYESDTTSAALTIGGTVTEIFGDLNRALGAHAFIVASGAGGTDLVLTVSGNSITDQGVRTAGDSEVIVSDTDQVVTNQYFETSKKWLGQITYTLTGTSGSFTFNYGFAKYDDFGNRNFTTTDFEIVGLAGAAAANVNIELLHHKFTGWTYHPTVFIPGSDSIASMATDYGADQDFDAEKPFAYKRVNLTTFVNGRVSEGVLIRFSIAINNAIRYATVQVGVLI
jgi:hypothetical protein